MTAFRADAAQGNIEGGHFETGRERDLPQSGTGGEVNIRHFATFFAEKMAMLAHVRAKARGAAVQRDLADKAALHKNAETIVDRGEGNLRHALFGAVKNFIRRGVIVAGRHHFKDLFALAGGTESTRLEGVFEFRREQLVVRPADGNEDNMRL